MFNGLRLAAIPPEDEALRPAVRDFIDDHVRHLSLEQRVRTWMAGDAAFSRKLGEAGFLGLTIPKRWGGQERGPFARFVVVEELLAAGAPVASHWVGDRQTGPMLVRYGSDKQRAAYLPGICRGEIAFCIGMSEAEAGSDLAAVRSRADRTASGWRLNGRKLWTSGAQNAHFMLALVRTSGSPDDRHAGLSQLIVPLDAQGVTVRPIADLNGHTDFCEVFLDDVMLSDDALVGTEGSGWSQVTTELAFERSGPERIYSSLVLFDAWVTYVKATGADQARNRLIGGVIAQLATLRACALTVTQQLADGESPVVEASLVKDLGTALEQTIPPAIADDLASRQDGPVPPELAAALMQLLLIAPAFSLRGGTREILRGIITRGLGLR